MPDRYPTTIFSIKELLVVLVAICIFMLVLAVGTVAGLHLSKRQFETEAQNIAAVLRSGISVADGLVTSLNASDYAITDDTRLLSHFSDVFGNYDFVSALGRYEGQLSNDQQSHLPVTIYKSRYNADDKTPTDLTGFDLSVLTSRYSSAAKSEGQTVITSLPDEWSRPGELLMFQSGVNVFAKDRGYLLELDLDEMATSGGVEINRLSLDLSVFSEQGEFASDHASEELFSQTADFDTNLKFGSWFAENTWLKSFTLGDKTLLLKIGRPTGLRGSLVAMLCLAGTFLSLMFLTIMRLIKNRRYAQKLQRIDSEKLYQARYQAAVTLASIDDAVITTDVEDRVLYANEAAETLLGYSESAMQGQHVSSVVIQTEEDGHLVLLSADNSKRYINRKQSPLKDLNGEFSGNVLVLRDTTVEHSLTKELTHKVNHDMLTGLSNRLNFESRLRKLILADEEIGDERLDFGHVLCFIDLDRFKEVNDTCGHDAGDELLKRVADTFCTNVRENDLVARLGGDEFGIVLRNCSRSSAQLVTDRIQKCFQSFFFEYEGHIFPVRCSIGWVHFKSGFCNFDDVIKSGDAACFDAKHLGRNSVCERLVGDNKKRTDQGGMWLPRLKSALADESFELLTQPVISLRDGSCVSHEVLLRLNENGVLTSPSVFMKSAVRYELAEQIDRWVVQSTLSRINALRPEYSKDKFAINLSSQSIESVDFKDFLCEQIGMAGIDPARLCFDIKESDVLSKPANSVEFCGELRSMGCDVALDDFGAGLTSFGLLKTIPLTMLKIDNNLIGSLGEKSVVDADYALVESINSFASSMGLSTIAEQVESIDCVEALKKINVDFVQGSAVAVEVPFSSLLIGASDSDELKAA